MLPFTIASPARKSVGARKFSSRLTLRGDETLLDAGCGTGRLTTDLLEALPQRLCRRRRSFREHAASAREHLAQFGERVTLLAECDLLHLPFERVFDGIVSTAAFHWVLDHDRLFFNLRSARSRRMDRSAVRR